MLFPKSTSKQSQKVETRIVVFRNSRKLTVVPGMNSRAKTLLFLGLKCQSEEAVLLEPDEG